MLLNRAVVRSDGLRMAASPQRPSWLCRDDVERERVVDMERRLRPVRVIAFAILAGALVVTGQWVGWWTLLGPTVPLNTGRGFQTVGQFHQGPNPGSGRWMPSPPIATSIQSVDPPIWVIHNGDTETLYTQDTMGGPPVILNRWTQMIYHIIFSYTPSSVSTAIASRVGTPARTPRRSPSACGWRSS